MRCKAGPRKTIHIKKRTYLMESCDNGRGDKRL